MKLEKIEFTAKKIPTRAELWNYKKKISLLSSAMRRRRLNFFFPISWQKKWQKERNKKYTRIAISQKLFDDTRKWEMGKFKIYWKSKIIEKMLYGAAACRAEKRIGEGKSWEENIYHRNCFFKSSEKVEKTHKFQNEIRD